MAVAPDGLSPALEALITRYAAMLKQVGARYGLTAHLVDEVIQEVRISLWRARPDVTQLATVTGGYMYRTSVTAALIVLRRRRARRQSAHELSTTLEQTIPSVAATPAESLERDELATAIRTAVESLDAPRQAVVRLHVRGYHRDEIAQLLGWSEAKTRNLLYRGLEDLRQILTARGVSPEHVA